MSLSSAEAAYHDEGADQPDGYVTEEVCEDAFRHGAQACREMMARFLQDVEPEIAASIRANWSPSWGDDPGPLDPALPVPANCWEAQ